MKQIKFLKNKKGVMKNWLIGLVLFSMIIAGISTFYISTTKSYNVTDIDTNFSSTYNVMEGMENMSSEMQAQVSGGSPSFVGTTILITKGVWTAIQLPFRSIAWVVVMTGDARMQFDLPPWFTGGIVLIVILMLIFAVIAAIFKVKNI